VVRVIRKGALVTGQGPRVNRPQPPRALARCYAHELKQAEMVMRGVLFILGVLVLLVVAAMQMGLFMIGDMPAT
jgi:hypothetical protein